jgi:predicted ATPase/class 3 adenylate cyclase
MVELPTGTVTFLFTDIEGSTRMWERDPRGMQTALARHDDILRGAIEAREGYVFKMVGDAFCAAFADASGAVGAALAAQRTLFAEGWAEGFAIKARMALHTGMAEESGGDYFGPPVNRVARLVSAGHGGQTLLSSATRELVRDQLPEGTDLRDLGERRLKDLFLPERVFQLLSSDLPSSFPPLRTLDARLNNLPVQPTPLVGREKEVAEVCGQLRRADLRLLTLTGPGGTGKTRLGLQGAAELLDEFEDGVFFVALSPIRDPALVAPTIAGALDVREISGRPVEERLKDYLRNKEMLLVLDNFEQVVEAAPLVGSLLGSCPGLKVLATSRATLRLYGEHELPVPPLAVADTKRLPEIRALAKYGAVRLFIDRAQDVKPNFAITNENAPAVAEICARLDGLPLAIELAAARIKLLPPEALLGRLSNRLKLLTGGARDLPARHQTLRGAIEWSHDLLDEGEKTLFARLAVFSGGRTLEAIEAVCDARGDLPVDAFEGVSSLLDKSLLRREEGLEDEPRLVMLETIHEFAREKLEESGEAEEIGRLHAEYFLHLAEEAEPKLVGPDQAAWMDRLEAEHDNFRAALSWSLGGGDIELGLRLAGALWRFWHWRDHWREGSSWYEEGLKGGDTAPQAVRAKALLGAGVLLRRQDEFESSTEHLEKSLALYRQLGDTRGAATSLGNLGHIALDWGDFERAERLLEESLALARESGSSWDTCNALRNLARLEWYRGKRERAQTLGEESFSIARKSGNTYAIAVASSNLAIMAMLGGDYERAETLYEEILGLDRRIGDRSNEALHLNNFALLSLLRGEYGRAAALSSESLALSRELLDHVGVTVCLDTLAAVSGEQGDVSRAARLWGAAEALREAIGIPQPPDDKEVLDPFLKAARSRLDETAWNELWTEGRTMTQERAVALALGGGDEDGQTEDTRQA